MTFQPAHPFQAITLAPRDPILGLNEQFQADTRSDKVNLGVGVYTDDAGRLPLLACVQTAEREMAQDLKPRGYLPIDGLVAYNQAVQALDLGEKSALLAAKQVAVAQTLGGTGALKIGADFLKRVVGLNKVLISDPSWENHRALFTQAGFEVGTYAYYDAANKTVAFDQMLADLHAAQTGTVVVLHACCHNPTGYDLSPEQWTQVVQTCQTRSLVPFLDMAYQGFGHGLSQDKQAVNQFVQAGMSFLVASSFSKSFSLYGERVGALLVVCGSADQASRVQSQIKVVIRTNYSNPPTHGAQIVARVLTTPALRQQWEEELEAMRLRIAAMRQRFVQGLQEAGVTLDFSFVARQLGMFSYSGLSAAQMQTLRQEHGVYGVDSGRICVAALNTANIDRVCEAMANITKVVNAHH
jgi:aromatic-amino-acid transaminase